MSDTAAQVEHLSKMYRLGVINNGTLFRDIQTWIALKQGDRVGIIVKNGAGKSTSLKILSRITAPTEGTVKIKGKVKTDFYTDDREYICSRILESGDIILLVAGGHGFEMLEVKQCPYAREGDKTRFERIDDKNAME